jgi:hypothetical protein
MSKATQTSLLIKQDEDWSWLGLFDPILILPSKLFICFHLLPSLRFPLLLHVVIPDVIKSYPPLTAR